MNQPLKNNGNQKMNLNKSNSKYMRFFFPCMIIITTVFTSINIAFAQKTTTVKTEGVGTIIKGDLSIARDRALTDAMRRAVEQAVGTLVDSETVVENYQLISDKIYTNSRGYIKRYTVVSEKAETQNNLFRITINAEVTAGDLKSDLEAIGVLIEQKGKPRMMVILDEKIGNINGLEAVTLAESELAIIDTFTLKGFNFVDEAVVKQNIQRENSLQKLLGDTAAAASLGLQYGAEVIITGTAIANAGFSIGGSQMKSMQATVAVKAIQTDTGKVIATESQRAAMAHINEMSGAAMALKKAGQMVSDRLIKKILDAWSSEVSGTGTVQMILTGVSFFKLTKFKKVLKEIRGVKSVNQRTFAAGTAVIDVESSANAQTLAETLSLKEYPSFTIEIVGLSANKIEIQIKK